MAQSISSNRKTAQQSLRAAAEDLAGEIATLNMLEPAALLQKWKALFGTDPSPLLARIFMVRAIAYRLQEQRYGGLKPSTQRLLDRVGEGRADVGRKRMPDSRVSAALPACPCRIRKCYQSRTHRKRKRACGQSL